MKNSNKEPVRILQILPGGKVNGGIENFVMNYYRNIDRNHVQFDFLVHYKEKGYFDDEIKKLGGKIYYFSVREDKRVFKYIKDLVKFFREHREYKIIHGHMPGLAIIYFFIAKICKISVRISHSHVTTTENTFKGIILRHLIKLIKYFSNCYFACSMEAGKFMFGRKKFEIIHNAIDIEKFTFNLEKRKEIRKKLGLENNFVIGHVGRFDLQKNHEFIVEVFNEVYKKNNNVRLLLIGEGILKEKIKTKVKKLGLENKVIFNKVVSNVNDYMCAMDIFLLPSIFEGLGIVGIEAQATGLFSIFSDVVPKEVEVSNLCKFISLKNKEKWVEVINNFLTSSFKREKNNYLEVIQNSGYDIKIESLKLEKKYIEIYEREI